MPARAGIKVTRTTTRTRSSPKTKGVTVDLGSKGTSKGTNTGARKRCPVCGKYMGSGKRG